VLIRKVSVFLYATFHTQTVTNYLTDSLNGFFSLKSSRWFNPSAAHKPILIVSMT